MTKKYRIGFGRFMQETNSFSSVPTTLDDFKRTHFVEGAELLEICEPKKWEVKGFLRNLELSGFIKAIRKNSDIDIEPVPLFSAWSISGGPVDKESFNIICEKLKEKLQKAGELDAVFFALHGALGVEGESEPEGKLLKIIRDNVGDKAYISSSMDLHGNLTREKVKSLNFLHAYKTNPHRDMARVGYKAGNIMIKTLTGKINPTTAWRALPMLMGGGTTIDIFPPMLSVFNRMKQIEEDPRVLDSSIFMCHPFLNHPDLGWSVYVITDNNQELAEQLADELAERCWALKDKLPPKFISADEMIDKVKSLTIARKMGCITVCDASDVVGAGGTGENTALLKVIMEKAPDLISYIPIRSPYAISELWDKPENESVEIAVGGKLQPEINEKVLVRGKIRLKKETENFGKVIVIQKENISLVITEGYAMPMKPSFYEDLGLQTLKADLVIVKNFFHFRIYFLLKSRKAIYVKTKGITDLEQVLQIETNYPAYPKDKIDDWKEIDKAKRGVNNSEQENIKSLYLLKRNKNKLLIKIALPIGLIILGGIFFYKKRNKS